MYITVQNPSRNDDATTPPFRITIPSGGATCGPTPIMLVVPSADNAYIYLLSIQMSDADLDCLLEQATAAKAQRTAQKAEMLSRLQAELEPTDPSVSA